MKNTAREVAKVYSSNDWAYVYSVMSGMMGVVIGLIIANFIGWI
jgi:uncharacterized protein YacL